MITDTQSSKSRSALHRLLNAVADRNDTTTTLNVIAHEAMDLTQASSAVIGVLSPDGDFLDIISATGENAAELMGLRLITSSSQFSPALSQGAPVAIRVTDDEPSNQLNLPIGFICVCPIQQSGRNIGAIAVTRASESQPFIGEDEERLSLLADIVAILLQRDKDSKEASSKARELRALYQLTETVGTNPNLSAVLGTALRAASDGLEHHSATIFLLNDEKTHLFIAADVGLSEEEREVMLSATDPHVIRLLKSNDATMLTGDELLSSFPELSGPRQATILSAPIRTHVEPVGLLLVTSSQRDAYDERDAMLVAAVARQAGLAIENARLYEDATLREREARALYEISLELSTSLDASVVSRVAAERACDLLQTDCVALYRCRSHTEKEVLTAIASSSSNLELPNSIEPGNGIVGWVSLWQTPASVADVAADSRNATMPLDLNARSALCVPITFGETTIGAILAISERRRLFTVADLELLYTIANQTAIALANASRFEAVRIRKSEMANALKRTARGLGLAIAENEIPRLFAHLAVSIMQADKAMLYRVGGSGLFCTATVNLATGPGTKMDPGEGLAGAVMRSGRPLAIHQLGEYDPNYLYRWIQDEEVCGYLGLPIKSGRRLVGILEIYTREPRTFSIEEIRTLTTFARRARVADSLLNPTD